MIAEMDTSDFVSLEQPDGDPKQKGPKLKPKRGKATQKQKRRLALKLDKVQVDPLVHSVIRLSTTL